MSTVLLLFFLVAMVVLSGPALAGLVVEVAIFECIPLANFKVGVYRVLRKTATQLACIQFPPTFNGQY